MRADGANEQRMWYAYRSIPDARHQLLHKRGGWPGRSSKTALTWTGSCHRMMDQVTQVGLAIVAPRPGVDAFGGRCQHKSTSHRLMIAGSGRIMMHDPA
jgi:hypothetical protein